MPVIEILGYGNVAFPDTMSNQDIEHAITNNIMPTIKATQPAASSAGVPSVAPTPSALVPPVPEKEATVLSQLVGGTKQVASDYSTLIQSLGSKENANKAALDELQHEQDIGQEIGHVKGIPEVKKAYAKEGILGAAKEIATQIPGAIASSGPQMATTIGGNVVGAALSKNPIGAYAGGFAALYPQFYMQNLAEQADQQLQKGQPVDVNRGKAATAAALQAGIEEAGTIYAYGKNFLKDVVGTIPKTEAEKALATKTLVESAKSVIKSVGVGTAKTAVEESIVNPSQTLLERWQSGQDLFSKEAMDQYGADVYGSLLQSPLGSAAGFHEVHTARNKLAEAGLDWQGNPIEGPQPQSEGQKALSDSLGQLSTKPDTTKTPQPNVVTPEQLLTHAETRLQELETKANGTPAQETVDETGNKITIPAQPAQAMTPQETAELKFLTEHKANPEKLAEGYGVTIGTPQVTGSHNTQAAIDELNGKPMPISPIYQEPKPVEPTKPAEPEVPPAPEKPPVEETPPVETKPEEKPPVEETPPQTQGAIVKDNNGTEHPLPTIADAEKNGAEYSPINRDKPMYVKTDLDGVFGMIYRLFKENTHPYVTGTTTKVTSNKNATLPKTSNKNQISVTFRPDTLSGRQLNDNEFMSYDTAHKAIESFTIYNPASRLRVAGIDARLGVKYLDKFFNRGLNPDGSITYTLKRVKSQEEKQADDERLSKEYLEHINRSRGKLTHKYTRKRKPGLNPFQESINQHETLGSALKDILARLEKAIANNEYEMLFKDINGKEQVEEYAGKDPALRHMSKPQIEMYVEIIKHLMKIDPVMKAHVFMDPYIVGGKYNTTLGFYRRTENILALFANADLPTLIHESIHAATHHYITMHPNDAKVKKLDRLLQESRKGDKKIRGKWQNYGNTDLDEFIAEAFSDPDFIKRLKGLDPVFDKSEATSIFDNIKTIVSNMMKSMGINVNKDRSVFDEVMDLSSDLFTGKTLEGYRYDVGHPLDVDTGNVKEDIGYHAGDLGFGFDTVLGRMGGRSTGHFGTGVYFVGHPDRLGTFRSDRPVNTIDFSKYNLAKPANREDAFKLHDGLKDVNESVSAMVQGLTEWKGYWGKTETLDALINDATQKISDSLGLNNTEDIKKIIIEEAKKASKKYESVAHTNTYVPTASTEVMKALGYDGVDVRNIADLDNTSYGSVIYKKSLADQAKPLQLESNIDTKNQRPITEEEAQQEEGSRQVFNYRNEPIDIRKWEIPEQGKIAARLSKWFQEFADEHVTITKVQNAIKALGRSISDMSDTEKKQELKNSRISDQLLRFVNEEVNPIVKEMVSKGVSIEEINKYLHARHAEAYNNRMNDINHRVDAEGNIIPYALKDRASGMTTQDANNYLNNLDPERTRILESVADKWYAIRDKTQEILVSSGQETQETIDLWKDLFPDYVPLNREQEQQAVPSGMRTGAGVDVRGNFSKRAMGSEKQVTNIVDALMYQRERSVARAENNEVGKSVYRLALENPNPDFWMAINPDAIHSREKLIQELEDMGYANAEEIADNIMAEPKERYLRKVRATDFVIDPTTGLPIPNSKEVVDARISRNARFGDNVLTLKVNGRERYVFFNQKDPNAVTMVRTLKNLDAETLGKFLSLNRFINHYFGQLYTVLNPVFGIVNGIRDYPFGMANLSTTPIRGKQTQVSAKIFPAMMGIMGVLRKERAGDGSANNRWQQIYKEATEAGFQTSNRYGILNTGEDKSHIEETLNKFKDGNSKKAFRYIIGMTYDFASMIENGVRLASYQQMREAGYTPQQSASVAKNLTINFDKKGARTGALRSLYLFFNASVRGTVRLAETLGGPSGGRIIAGGMLLGVMQALLCAGAGFKDDDPPEYIKEHNLIIPTGDGKYKTIPMPYGLNILPNTGRIVTEYALEVGKHSDKSLAEGFAKAHAGKKAMAWTNSLFSTFSPFGNQGLSLNAIVPSAIEPIVGVGLTNKNSFGQTISRQDSYNRPTPGYMRTKESGTGWGKEFARWMNLFTQGTDTTKGAWSPTGDDIDFLAASVTGPVVGSVAKTAKYIKAKMAGEEVPAYQTPVLGRFEGEIDSKPVITSRFYNNINAMYEHELTLNNLKGDPQATQKYIQENPDARAYKRAEHVESQINNLNARKKKFESRGAPKEALQRLDNQKIIIMNRFNDQLDRIRNQ